MISCFKKALVFSLIVFGSISFAFAQTALFEVASTPYDRQMERIQPTLTAPSAYTIYGPSLLVVNEWMIELRGMPYRYSREWRTPFEVAAAQVGDCKGKAVLLYNWMQSNGATNVRLVIGKRRAGDSLTHAWVEWQTTLGTLLLDPTFNWNAAIKATDGRNYIPFYGYAAGHKYQAANLFLARRAIATRAPAAPAHGVITRPVRLASRMRPTSPLFDESPIAPNFFNCRSGF